MPARKQLEIISPTGEINFVELDPAQGITNIGRHAENDIVLSGANIALFYATLDHRQEPCQIMLLDAAGETTLRGERLLPNVFTALNAWDTLEIDGYTLILLEGAGVAAPAPAPPEPETVAPVAPVPAAETPVPASALTAPSPAISPGLAPSFSDQDDPVILIELAEREWNIDVDQTAICRATVINGGPIVAAFEVHVQGVNANWVEITPPRVNLNEGERATVTIAITPPRHPSSRAGAHRLAVVATSPNYAGRSSQKGATLIINPYYEFAVGEPSPKEQTVSWRKRTGQIVIPIANKGNSETPFRIEAQDTEQACGFEFQVPGETASLARQADMRLPPEETFAVPVQITPHSRRLVSLRKRRYSFTATSTMLEGQQSPRSVMGQLNSKPLIGPGLMALIVCFLAVLIAIIFQPRIYKFAIYGPGGESVSEIGIWDGDSVTLTWDASPFASLKIDPEVGTVGGPGGKKEFVPTEDGEVTYTLRADNLLSRFIPQLFGAEKTVKVRVGQVKPGIISFRALDGDIVQGESTALEWVVADASEVEIFVNPPTDSGDRLPVASDQFSGQYKISPEDKTTYTLKTGSVSDLYATRQVEVQVRTPTPVPTPTPTPVPPPVIESFVVEPERAAVGEEVLLNWSVIGADRVTIDLIGEVDQVGPHIYTPEKPGTLSFWLEAFKEGAEPVKQLRKVIVDPAPAKPVIEFFRATPDEVVMGVDNDDVELAWSVSVTGSSTDTIEIEISSSALGTISGLGTRDTLPVTVDKTTLFILTASNGDLSASETVEIKVEPAPTPTPTATPPPPTPVIVFYAEESKEVTRIGEGIYEVDAGSDVKLRWSVQNADTLNLYGLQYGLEVLIPTSEGKTLPFVTTGDTYYLTAENAGGREQESVEIRIKDVPSPPPPTAVNGEPLTNTIRITWNYRAQDEDKIVGFEVYRADMPPGTDFSSIADWENDDLGPSSREWVDRGASPTCGRVYYVVAVYYDIVSGKNKKTDASSTSWSSQPCTTPTN